MVYLFDDTSDQFIGKFIDLVAYNGILVKHSRMTPEELSSIRDSVTVADCICIHRSLKDADNDEENRVFEEIVYNISEMGRSIPLVIFSGEDMTEPDFKTPTFIRKINKDRFYGNLKAFLDDYRDSATPNLMCLAHGRDVDASVAISEAQAILKRIRFKDAGETLTSNAVAGASLMAFVKYSQPEIGCSYGEVIANIDQTGMTVGAFREKITEMIKSFSDYGKNIYSWR